MRSQRWEQLLARRGLCPRLLAETPPEYLPPKEAGDCFSFGRQTLNLPKSVSRSAAMTEMVSPLPQSRRLRDRLLLAGLLALVGLGLLGLAAKTGWDETLAQIGKLGFGQIVVLLGLSLVNYVFRGLRWHLLARRLGLETGLLQDMRHFLGGFAMSVTPGRVGELVRMRWLRRETGWPVERTAPLPTRRR